MDFDSEWGRCAPWIEAALEHGAPTHTLEDVKACVERGEARLWAGKNAAMITQFEDFPRMRTFNVWLAGGDMRELLEEMRPAAEQYAKDNGAKLVVISGRSGWSRALGYNKMLYTCAKELI